MSIVFTSMHDDHYSGLAELTLNQNKRLYCEKHGYPLLVKTDGWHGIQMGYEKTYLLKDAFEKYPDCVWIFFSECDTLITNMDIKLEDIIKNEEKHFVITVDVNGINAGSFFVRNSQQGRDYIDAMFRTIGHFPNEQDFIRDSYFYSESHKDIISLYPQKRFNSYDYDFFGQRYPTGLDYFGNNGQWENGDFILHFVDRSLEKRLELAEKYLPLVKCSS